MSTSPRQRPLRRIARRSSALALLVAGMTAAAVGGAGAVAPPEGPAVRHAGGPDAIPDSYIVVLRDDAPGMRDDSAVARVARRHSADVRHAYTSALHGFSATMSAGQARRLAADPDVAYVEQDSLVSGDTVQTSPTWGLDRVDERSLPLDAAYSYDTTAPIVTVYVLDSGIRPDHTQFVDAAGASRVTLRRDYVKDGMQGWNCNSHGTHVAGTIGGTTHGVAKGVRLVDLRVLGCDNTGAVSRHLQALDWVTANRVRPAVANMSLGRANSDALDDGVRRSITSGVTYVVSAGNNSFDACLKSPARVGAALTVGATTAADARWSSSNFGPCVDLFAPGASIRSAVGTSRTATALFSGTSMAAPHVAGAAALYLAKSQYARPSEVHAALVNNSTAGKVSDAGAGSPNRLLFRPRGAVLSGLVCDSASSRVFCTVSHSTGAGPVSIRWTRGGVHVPSWDNLRSIGGACTVGVTLSIGVTVTDPTAEWRTGRSTPVRCASIAP